jgi:hypothetical protein
MKALMTLVLFLLLAGCAAGQANAGRTLAEEETTANSTEETTVYKEETTVLEAEGNPSRPPDSTLSYGGREVKGTLGSYCWFSGNSGACADTFRILVPSKERTLTVPSGSEMVFHFGGQSSAYKVEGATAYPINKINKWGLAPRYQNSGRALKVHGSGIERAIPAELPLGEYVVDVFITVRQGDATYYFRIMVE